MEASALPLTDHVLMRRGTTAAINGYAGVVGELLVDTTKNTVVLPSGTAGTNYALAREDVTVTAGNGITLTVGGTGVASTTLAQGFTIQANMSALLAPAGTKGQLLETNANNQLAVNMDLAYDTSTGTLSIVAADGTTVYDSVTIPNAVTALSIAELLTASAGQPVDGNTSGKFLHLRYTLSSGSNSDVYINVTDLVDVYTAGNGLSLTGNEFAVVAADGSISVTASGVSVGIKSGEAILKKDGTTSELYIDTAALNQAINEVTVVSEDTGNVLQSGTDDGALLKLATGANLLSVNASGELFVPSDLGVITA